MTSEKSSQSFDKSVVFHMPGHYLSIHGFLRQSNFKSDCVTAGDEK